MLRHGGEGNWGQARALRMDCGEILRSCLGILCGSSAHVNSTASVAAATDWWFELSCKDEKPTVQQWGPEIWHPNHWHARLGVLWGESAGSQWLCSQCRHFERRHNWRKTSAVVSFAPARPYFYGICLLIFHASPRGMTAGHGSMECVQPYIQLGRVWPTLQCRRPFKAAGKRLSSPNHWVSIKGYKRLEYWARSLNAKMAACLGVKVRASLTELTAWQQITKGFCGPQTSWRTGHRNVQ